MNMIALQQDNWAASLNGNQTKALSLLGQGISAVMVASTLGVSESLVSQYISDPRFAEEVTKLKLATLQIQTDIDSKHMKAENLLLDKLIKTIPLISKPMDILRGIQVINATKRRGMADTVAPAGHTQIVQINLPASMAARFITNTANQIVEIQDSEGARSLVTSTPEAVSKYALDVASERVSLLEENNHGEFREGFREGLGAPGPGTNRISEDSVAASWETVTSTEDRIKRASEVLSKLSASSTSRERQVGSAGVKGQITADDL